MLCARSGDRWAPPGQTRTRLRQDLDGAKELKTGVLTFLFQSNVCELFFFLFSRAKEKQGQMVRRPPCMGLFLHSSRRCGFLVQPAAPTVIKALVFEIYVIFTFFLYVDGLLPAYMFVYHLDAWWPWRPEEAMDPSGTEVIGVGAGSPT